MTDRCSATGKVRHASKEGACIAAKRVKNKLLNVYRCQKCKGWHTGRSRDPYRNAARVTEILDRHERELIARLSTNAVGGQ